MMPLSYVLLFILILNRIDGLTNQLYIKNYFALKNLFTVFEITL